MLAEYIIEKYKQDLMDTMSACTDKKEIESLDVIGCMLHSALYNVRALMNEFPLTEEIEEVYLFDLKRNMFWKQNQYGYTKYISEAGLFNIEKAKSIAENDMDEQTKIVYFFD